MEARERAEQLRLQMEERFREMEERMQKKEKEVGCLLIIDYLID